MKIKNTTSKKVKASTIVAIIGVLLLSFFILIKDNPNIIKNISKTKDEASARLNSPTVLKTITYAGLFETTDHELYSDATLSVYIANTTSVPKLIYKYNKKPEGRDLSDSFFIHVYVKDSTKLKGNAQ